MPGLFTLSRRALASANPPILDFLAPTLCYPSTSFLKHASTSVAPSETPSARAPVSAFPRDPGTSTNTTTSKSGRARSHQWSDATKLRPAREHPPPPTRHRTSEVTAKPAKKPLAPKPRPSPSSRSRRQPAHKPRPTGVTDPLNLLQAIRSTKTKSTKSSSEYDVAHHQLMMGTSGHLAREYTTAFERGWRVIKGLGEAGRIPTATLVKVLETCSTPRGEQGEWKEIRELVLWLAGAGEEAVPGLVNWAWKEMEKGESGAARVVEIWEKIVAKEHLELRRGPEAFDRCWSKEAMEDPFDTAKPRSQKLDSRLFSAYIVARSVVHSAQPSPPPFATVLPTLFPTSGPSPRITRARTTLDPLKLALSSRAYSSHPDAANTAEAWLRQADLFQLWYHNGAPGMRFVARVKQCFREGNPNAVREMWTDLKEGAESENVRWIEMDKWNESATMRWIDGRDGIELESESKEEKEEVDGAVGVTVDHEGTGSIPHPQTSPTIPPRTYLFQAHLAPLIAGFTSSRNYILAGEIWNWISPPLTYGVVSWTAILQGYTTHGPVSATLDVWRQMEAAGVKPDVWAWAEYFSVYFYSREPDMAMQIVGRMLADEHVRSTWRDGKLPEVVYRRIIIGLLRNARLAQAQELLKKMREEGVEVTTSTVNLFLRHYTTGTKPDFPAIISSLKLLGELDLQANIFTYTMILQSLLASKQAGATAKLMQIMDSVGVKPNTTTYGAIINSLVQDGDVVQLRAAVEMLNEMESRRFSTNEIIYTSIIQGFLRAVKKDKNATRDRDPKVLHPHFQAALAVKRRMESKGIYMNRIGYNALISSGLSLRSPSGMELALSMFRELQKKRMEANADKSGTEGKTVTVADSWYVLLDGLAQMGEWKVARGMLEEMRQSGFVPHGKGLQRLVDGVVRGGYYTP